MKVRIATSNDVPLIFSFIQKKAEFDRSLGAFSGTLQTNEAKISKTLFEAFPFSYVLFAENLEREVVGFALYGFRYSSFAGQPSIWLDDLYVEGAMRNQGAGTALMNYLAGVAKDNNCTHLGWHADDRNVRALQFYHRLGAAIVQQNGNRCTLEWKP
ncbi:MAG: GNAT family N-acetyltransferase [Prochloraceae cyanobacterium]|nr:GNAT family N-acetyltransferase [Prochloraceae cyanobacterium]